MGNPQKPISDVLLLHTDAAADTICQSLIKSCTTTLPIAYILPFFADHAYPRNSLNNMKRFSS